jgi:hypothetical protein
LLELAPFQRVPRSDGRPDHRQGTIATDEHYLQFLGRINAKVDLLPSADIQYERQQAALQATGKAPVETPLVLFLKDKLESRQRSRSVSNRHDFPSRNSVTHTSPLCGVVACRL